MAVIRKEAYYSSANERNMIRTLIWQDDTVETVAVVQIAHGVAEHIERYDAFARYLTQFGFVVCGNDHIGHGKSVLRHDCAQIPRFPAQEQQVCTHVLQGSWRRTYPRDRIPQQQERL